MNKIWYQKHRPKNLDGYIFPTEEIQNFVLGMVETSNLRSLLLTGIQGTGKSTLANALVEEFDIDKSDRLRINASSDNGVDVARSIESWCTGMPYGDFKVVVLEESERLSYGAQKILLDVIEKFDDRVKFILTSNRTDTLLPAMLSRLQQVTFDTFNEEGVIGYLVDIIVAEDVIVPSEDILFEHINAYKPDVRKIINSIEQSSVTGTLQGVIKGGSGGSLIEEWTELWASSPDLESCVKYITQADEQNIIELLTIMYRYIGNIDEDRQYPAITKIGDAIERVSNGWAADMEILLYAALIEIFMDL